MLRTHSSLQKKSHYTFSLARHLWTSLYFSPQGMEPYAVQGHVNRPTYMTGEMIRSHTSLKSSFGIIFTLAIPLNWPDQASFPFFQFFLLLQYYEYTKFVKNNVYLVKSLDSKATRLIMISTVPLHPISLPLHHLPFKVPCFPSTPSAVHHVPSYSRGSYPKRRWVPDLSVLPHFINNALSKQALFPRTIIPSNTVWSE